MIQRSSTSRVIAASSSVRRPTLQYLLERHSVESRIGERRSARAAAWQVVHACDSLRPVLPVIEAQTAVGIRPYVLTPQGECLARDCFRSRAVEKRKSASLLNAWSEVRNWRRNLVRSEIESGIPAIEADLVHAHSFPAGMAAVRNCRAVVYTLYEFIEQQAHYQNSGKDHSWLARSFAVAEQFVFTRAGAVVVQSGALRQAVIERGCSPENVFQIPECLNQELMESLGRSESLLLVKTPSEKEITLFAPDMRFDCDSTSPGELNGSAACLLDAFALLRREIERARLFLPATPDCAAALLEKTTALGIADAVFALPATDAEKIFSLADVVIAFGAASENPGPTAFAQSDYALPRLSAATRAMISGGALLAADNPGHRDLSAEGRGLLWFREGDAKDLAARAAFLARNPELRRALGAAAGQHLMETRSLEAVGRQYDRVYRHVFGRRKSDRNNPATGLRLQPVAACL